ncbi:MAG: diaminopimelate epimerase [Bacillaceae bacterium]
MEKSFRFTKMHGLGNTYVYVNLFEEHLEEEQLKELAIAVSNRNTGIGSDGMILICPSDVAPVKMRIFNLDGSEGKSCGNGLRCVAKYAYEHKLVEGTTFTIETLSGIVLAQVFVNDNGEVTDIAINMGEPRFSRKEIPMIGEEKDEIAKEIIVFEEKRYECTSLSMGNPHTVFIIEDIEEAPLTTLGPIMEHHEWFLEGVNTEFIQVINDHALHFRVWERGSGVTQACGTGACAAVVAATVNDKLQRGDEITVHLAGGNLFITWTNEGHVIMRGPATIICDGTYYY